MTRKPRNTNRRPIERCMPGCMPGCTGVLEILNYFVGKLQLCTEAMRADHASWSKTQTTGAVSDLLKPHVVLSTSRFRRTQFGREVCQDRLASWGREVCSVVVRTPKRCRHDQHRKHAFLKMHAGLRSTHHIMRTLSFVLIFNSCCLLPYITLYLK